MTNKIIIKSPYDKDTHVQFYFFHITHKSSIMYTLPIFGLLLILLFSQSNNNDTPTLFISFIIFMLIFMPIYIWIMVRSNVKRDSKTRINTTEIIEITKDKISRSLDNNSGKEYLAWNQIMMVYERENCFYIYTSNEHGFIINKKDIIEGDIESIRVLCNKNLLPNKKGKIPFKQIKKIKKELKK